jgi:hypothetical protein
MLKNVERWESQKSSCKRLRALVQGGVWLGSTTSSVTLKLGEQVSSYRSQNKGYVERSNPSDYSGRGRILPVVS